MQLKIAKPTAKDFDAVHGLLRQLWPDEPLLKKKVKPLFLKKIRSKQMLHQILLKDDELIGYASVSFIEDLQSQKMAAYLTVLIIDERFRDRGYGKRLLQQLITESKKSGCKEMHTSSSFGRKKAHKFYRSLGFQKTAYFFWKTL